MSAALPAPDPAWDLSCPDWQEKLRTGRTPIPDNLPIDAVAGDRAVAVFNKLRLFDVYGTPTMAEAGGQWFRDIVRVMFGSYDRRTHRRFIRELFLLLAKKQNKTTGGALLMLTALLLNERPRANLLFTGPLQKTADDAFLAAEGAIALDNVLHKKLHVRDHIKTIEHRETRAKLRILTFEPEVVTGEKVVYGLIDEEHVLGKKPRAQKAMVQLRGGMLPFPEAFLAIITTQSDETPTGVFKEDLDQAREIRDGKRVAPVLPVLYEFSKEMQVDPARPWRDPANWPIVMPNLGRSIHIETLIQAASDQEAKGPAAFQVWASQHLNIEIGLAIADGSWAGSEYWMRQEIVLSFDELLARCEVVVFGIDGGGLDDLLGLCAGGRERGTGKWLAWCHAWAHEIVLERRKEIAPKLLDLAAADELTIVDDPDEAVADVVEIVARALAVELLPEKEAVGVDQAGIGAIVTALEACGVATEQIVAIRQGGWLNSAIKTAERKLASRSLFVAKSLLMPWCVGNAKVEVKGMSLAITKQTSGLAKIDPLAAFFDMVSLLERNPVAKHKREFQFFAIG